MTDFDRLTILAYAFVAIGIMLCDVSVILSAFVCWFAIAIVVVIIILQAEQDDRDT